MSDHGYLLIQAISKRYNCTLALIKLFRNSHFTTRTHIRFLRAHDRM